jgi:hypothetical protein
MRMLNKISRLIRVAAAIAGPLAIAGCGGGGNGESVQPMGSLRVAVTDAPACGFDQVNITINRVRVHAQQGAAENASGWHDLALSPPRKINLLDLTNGVLEELGQMALPAGQYTQLRLVLQPNSGGAPANSVVPTGAAEQALDTPSAAQSGIKLIHPFTVPAGGLADVLLDFDACKSIVRRGNGSFGLKPVIAAIPRAVAEIVGNVDPALSGVLVSAQSGGNVLRATVPDANGAFKLAFLDPARTPSVAVVIVAPNRATAVIASVPIALQGSTRVSTVAAPLFLPTSATRTASGTVLPAAAAGSVRALQAAGAVPALEVASANADAAGAYSMTLPTAAPLLAPYSTTLPLIFVAQPATAARYSIEASAAGFTAQTTPVDLTAANATANFTLVPAP